MSGAKGTIESGTTVILMCTQMVLEDSTLVDYMWSREGGRDLPEGSQVRNGEFNGCMRACVCPRGLQKVVAT